jgi:molybdopterin biosynthesis enzyme
MPAKNVSLTEANGRVLAARLTSPISVPPFDKSTVDGLAILSRDTRKASRRYHIELDYIAKVIRVAVLSAGNELSEPGRRLGSASVFDSNRFMICSMVNDYGGDAVDLGECRDEKYLIHLRIMQALKFDVVFVSGGSSVGEKNYVPGIDNRHLQQDSEFAYHIVSLTERVPLKE